MKTRLLIAMICAVALCATLSVSAAKKEKKDPLAGIKCPVSNKAIKSASFLKHNGGKVYFCCDNCPKSFQAKAKDKKLGEKILAKVGHQFLQTGQLAQVACPFSGKPVNAETLVAFKGAKVGFCCNNCKAKFEKDPSAKFQPTDPKAHCRRFSAKRSPASCLARES